VAHARASGLDVHLLIVGSGEDDASLRALVQSLGMTEVVHFLGFRTDAGAVLRDATRLYLASAREEALPLGVLEAQWLGVPVVASDIVAHREALDGGRTGALVPAEDAVALGEAIVRLARSPAALAQLGQAGQAHARAHFALERYLADFHALYDELLAQPRSRFGWTRGSVWPREYSRWMGRAIHGRLRRLAGGVRA
jgi:glycosyltransferase involved in cell wall biosynthesis